MGMKYVVEKLDEVAETARSLYVARDGKYYLDVDGVVPKDRVDEFRNNNIALQQQLEKYKGIDPTKHAELMRVQQEIEEGKLIQQGKLDEVVNLRVGTMKTEYEGRISTYETHLQTANRQLETLMIDNVVKSAAIKAGVIPSAVDDVVLRAKTSYSMEKGVPTPKGADGQVIYGKDGSTPMPIEEWVIGLRKTAGHLFQGSNGSGAGNGGTSTGSADVSKMTASQKIEYGLSLGLNRTGQKQLADS